MRDITSMAMMATGMTAIEFAHHAGDEEGQECNDGRAHRRGYRGQDLDRAINGGLHIGLAEFSVFVDVLANHDRIVDDNPQRHQESEHAQHIQRLSGQRDEDDASPQHADGNPQRNPKCQPEFEK